MTRDTQLRQYLKERNIPLESPEAYSIIEGIEWADKHPALTWKDIKRIVEIADEMVDKDCLGELPKECETEERYYAEILRRFKEKQDESM